MDIERSEYGITVSAGDEYEAERLTRWECVKAAFALLWNACLPLHKPKPRSGRVLTPDVVALLALAVCRAKINNGYERAIHAAGATSTNCPPTNCS